MRIVLSLLLTAVSCWPQPVTALWDQLTERRQALTGARQEIELTQTRHSGGPHAYSHKEQITLDLEGKRWRQSTASGSGAYVRIFDGESVLWMESGGDEYERQKYKAKDPLPLPPPYSAVNLDWKKAKEVVRQPCGFTTGTDHNCVVIEGPIRPSQQPGSRREGSLRMIADLDTGLVLSVNTQEVVSTASGSSRIQSLYATKRMQVNAKADAAAFVPPPAAKQVKELTGWSADRLKKQYAGKPAPPLTLNDMNGKPVSLEQLKGKTVLLDFWATWCGPCRADAPALEKLHKKYGERDLAIVGISVSEERALVEQYLAKNPRAYPVALTTENEMPRQYQVQVFPTYMVIGADGSFISATSGSQGFGELRKMLKKAGLDID